MIDDHLPTDEEDDHPEAIDGSSSACDDGLAIDDIVGEDLSVEQHLRLLLRVLLLAVTDHVDSGHFVPSVELERAMESAKHELWN